MLDLELLLSEIDFSLVIKSALLVSNVNIILSDFSHVDDQTIERALMLLSFINDLRRNDSLALQYATYFVHLCKTTKSNLIYLKFVLIDVRVDYDNRLSWFRRRFQSLNSLFQDMSKEVQAINVVTFLENIIACETNDFRKVVIILQDMIKHFEKFEDFNIFEMKDMSLLLIIIVSRTLAYYQNYSLLIFLSDVVKLFRIILVLRDNTIAHLFEVTIAKLDNLEMLMCLALWLKIIQVDNDFDRSVAIRDLFVDLRSHYFFISTSHFVITFELMSVEMILKLLCLFRMTYSFFLDFLHYFMNEVLDRSKWKAIWKMLNEKNVYDRHQVRIERDNQSLFATWLLQNNEIL